MEYDEKFVEYDKYCSKCKNKDLDDSDDPCNECLTTPVNLNSHKPICFEES